MTDVDFFVPGTNIAASVHGFGVVFTDVDSPNVTSLQFFDLAGVSLGTFFAPNIAGTQTLSFVGVSFPANVRVARVRITSGNQVLAAGNTMVDGVVMDDFIYAEPQILPGGERQHRRSVWDHPGAINDANTVPTHVIRVEAGTYPELVTVNKAVTLRGARAGVDGRDPSRGTDESIVNGMVTGSTRTTAFHVTVDNVTIDGFTVQDATNTTQFGAGIVLQPGADGTQIRNNVVKNNVVGLFLAGSAAKPATVIENNLFTSNNQPGPAGGNAIYSDQFISGGTLSNVFINDNGFDNNDSAAVFLGATGAGSQTRIVISNNVMASNGNGVLLFNTADAIVARNDIRSSIGSQIVAGGGVNGLVITENFIESGSARGIRIGDFGGGGANANVVINCNSIQNNGGAGLQIESGSYTGTLNATGNWWNSATGPTHPANPGGTGQLIVDPAGQVNFAGFLTARNDQQPAAEGFECTRSAILYGVDASNNLVRFDSADPETILSSVAITGLQAGENILGIDFRPTTGELFAVGASERLYIIDVGYWHRNGPGPARS